MHQHALARCWHPHTFCYWEQLTILAVGMLLVDVAHMSFGSNKFQHERMCQWSYFCLANLCKIERPGRTAFPAISPLGSFCNNFSLEDACGLHVHFNLGLICTVGLSDGNSLAWSAKTAQSGQVAWEPMFSSCTFHQFLDCFEIAI